MKLNEVFDSSADWSPPKDMEGNPSYFDNSSRTNDPDMTYWAPDKYKFEVGGEKYEVWFYPITNKDQIVQPAPKNLPEKCDYVGLIRIDDEGEDHWDDSISGTGGAYKVFSTALNIIRSHAKRTGIPVIVGSKLSEPSRVKLYNRMFDKISKLKWKSAGLAQQDPEILWLLA